MTTLGQVLLAIAAIAALGSIGVLVWGHLLGPKKGESLTNAGYIATFVIFGATTAAVVLVVWAFLTKNFTFLYVVQNHSTDVSSLSWLYNLSGLWAGREGSLLFWAWLLSGYAAFMSYKRMGVTDPLSNVGLAVTNFVQLFFLVALFIPTNNPFHAATVAADGTVANAAGAVLGNINQMAMNPLLQHWAMILHPPIAVHRLCGSDHPVRLRAGRAVPGRRVASAWIDIVDRVTVFSWLFLGIGIGLGAIWAYVVLGWGGYWAWDPVENASLLPWLTGLALIHSFTVYRRREGFKRWSAVLAAVTFVLVLLGTFITRSGVIQSVHAFEQDPVSLWWFLSMMIVCLVVALVALALRRDAFRGNDDFTSLTSKEASYYFNNVIMLFSAIVVAGLTLAPVLGKTFSGSTYALLARPLGIFYIAIMAICPILSWRKTEGETFWRRVRVAARRRRCPVRGPRGHLVRGAPAELPGRPEGAPRARRHPDAARPHRGHHRARRRRHRHRGADLPVHRRSAQASRGSGRVVRRRSRQHPRQGALPVGRLHRAPRHGHRPHRPDRIGDVRA